MADICLASLVYLPCLRYHVLRAYCTFASKQAIPITLFGPRPNNNIVLLKVPTKYGEFFSTIFVKTTDFQFVFNFEQMHTVIMFGEHGIMAHIP